MSGAVCPDCGQPLEKTCPFCGWAGDVGRLPRKILYPESYEQLGNRLAEKRAGRLFVVVMDATDAGLDQAMDLLGATSASSAGRRHLLQLPARPSEETLAAVARLRGVRSVRLA